MLQRMAGLLLLVILVTGAVAAQSPNPGDIAEHHYAPYVNMGGYPTFFFAPTAKETGVRYFTLAFVQALGKKCRGGWAEVNGLLNPYLMKDLENLRAEGGDVIVSFGGAVGLELARACPDVDSLKKAYQEVIDIYGVTHLDFDLEGDDLDDAESVQRRSDAIAALQADYAGTDQALVISYTLPVLPSGLTHNALNALQSAMDAGVDVQVVNIMTMDFGASYIEKTMGEYTIDAAESLVGQLQTLYPDKTEAEVWGMVGVTPMIGINDVNANIFTADDAAKVVEFAKDKSIARIAMWSYERDKECINQQKVLAGNCSGMIQAPLNYSTIFNEFTDKIEP